MNLCQNINASWADVAGRSTFQRRRSPTFYPLSCSFDTCLIIGQLTDPAQSLCSERVWTAKLQKHRQIIASLCFESDNVMFRKHVQERLAPKVCLTPQGVRVSSSKGGWEKIKGYFYMKNCCCGRLSIKPTRDACSGFPPVYYRGDIHFTWVPSLSNFLAKIP